MKRLDAASGSALLTFGVVAAVGLLLSVLVAVPRGPVGGTDLASGNGGADATSDLGGAAGEGTGAGAGAGFPSSGEGQAGGAASGEQATTSKGTAVVAGSCARANGGATDVGVTGSSVKLAATIVTDGPGSSFLGPVRIGMNAVVNKVNNRGGICGRRLQLILRNDSWDASRGSQYIKNFVEGEKVFALAVVPSSEGLQAAQDYVASKGVPVVGTDGMLVHQYRNPWIWPVATSTISTMHVMAKDAYDRGARQFGIVFDAKYHFGVEGAFAFNEAVRRMTGQPIRGFDASLKSCQERFCGIQPGQPAYTNEASKFNEACFGSGAHGTCDFAAYLLEPETAVSFLREPRGLAPVYGTGGAQPLFNRAFAEACKRNCNGMRVWTGYHPPIDALASQPGVAEYVDDIRRESSSADVVNQFLQGGYLGMRLLVAALEKTGPNLTRQTLKATLDSMTFDTGLSTPLSWKAGDHFANKSAQAFEIQYAQTFAGWRHVTGFIADPWVGQDIPPGQ